jgi:DNA-binding CsgD family transcriptional regulator
MPPTREIRSEALAAAGREFLEATLLGSPLDAALESFARAAAADGACLVQENAHEPDRIIIPSPSLAEHISLYLAGKSPPNSRRTRVVVSPESGFVGDLEHYRFDELLRDPFYRDFLRPMGLGWHAAAWLSGEGATEIVISLKRSWQAGLYDREACRRVGAVLPVLRHASMIAVARAEARIRGAFDLVEGDRAAAVAFDHKGDVRNVSAAFTALAGKAAAVRGRRLVLAETGAQARLDRIVAAAATPPGAAGAILLADGTDRGRLVLRVAPVVGLARDVYGATAALGILARHRAAAERDSRIIAVVRGTAGLTPMEARVACRLADGFGTDEVADDLRISTGTVRNHLKVAMQKLDVSRQGELVALVGRVTP